MPRSGTKAESDRPELQAPISASHAAQASVAWLAQLIGQTTAGADAGRAKAAAEDAAAAYRMNQTPVAPGRATGGYLSLRA